MCQTSFRCQQYSIITIKLGGCFAQGLLAGQRCTKGRETFAGVSKHLGHFRSSPCAAVVECSSMQKKPTTSTSHTPRIALVLVTCANVCSATTNTTTNSMAFYRVTVLADSSFHPLCAHNSPIQALQELWIDWPPCVRWLLVYCVSSLWPALPRFSSPVLNFVQTTKCASQTKCRPLNVQTTKCASQQTWIAVGRPTHFRICAYLCVSVLHTDFPTGWSLPKESHNCWLLYWPQEKTASQLAVDISNCFLYLQYSIAQLMVGTPKCTVLRFRLCQAGLKRVRTAQLYQNAFALILDVCFPYAPACAMFSSLSVLMFFAFARPRSASSARQDLVSLSAGYVNTHFIFYLLSAASMLSFVGCCGCRPRMCEIMNWSQASQQEADRIRLLQNQVGMSCDGKYKASNGLMVTIEQS